MIDAYGREKMSAEQPTTSFRQGQLPERLFVRSQGSEDWEMVTASLSRARAERRRGSSNQSVSWQERNPCVGGYHHARNPASSSTLRKRRTSRVKWRRFSHCRAIIRCTPLANVRLAPVPASNTGGGAQPGPEPIGAAGGAAGAGSQPARCTCRSLSRPILT
jgi:hypothetical protein